MYKCHIIRKFSNRLKPSQALSRSLFLLNSGAAGSGYVNAQLKLIVNISLLYVESYVTRTAGSCQNPLSTGTATSSKNDIKHKAPSAMHHDVVANPPIQPYVSLRKALNPGRRI